MYKNLVTMPKEGDYPAYYAPYIEMVGEQDVLEFLMNQRDEFLTCLQDVPEEMGNYRYDKGKWTIKELVGHIIDCERIMAFRALSFSRGETQSIPGFEQDDYVRQGQFSERTLISLIQEFEMLRNSNLILFESFTPEMLNKVGLANGNPTKTYALLYVVAGHLQHHMHILKKKYLTLMDE